MPHYQALAGQGEDSLDGQDVGRQANAMDLDRVRFADLGAARGLQAEHVRDRYGGLLLPDRGQRLGKLPGGARGHVRLRRRGVVDKLEIGDVPRRLECELLQQLRGNGKVAAAITPLPARSAAASISRKSASPSPELPITTAHPAESASRQTPFAAAGWV